ncbi:hypothetical protein GWK47_046746 [Chionoecetes opilio]|uniref:Uncharacterized protein n=1 Tax=Chionoecetes opilio TaxID=41210 RepID=A0A8J5CW74_CHIOP|nr:hypothetical protein GWK47_046746 [Chionoecetes opilio]
MQGFRHSDPLSGHKGEDVTLYLGYSIQRAEKGATSSPRKGFCGSPESERGGPQTGVRGSRTMTRAHPMFGDEANSSLEKGPLLSFPPANKKRLPLPHRGAARALRALVQLQKPFTVVSMKENGAVGGASPASGRNGPPEEHGSPALAATLDRNPKRNPSFRDKSGFPEAARFPRPEKSKTQHQPLIHPTPKALKKSLGARPLKNQGEEFRSRKIPFWSTGMGSPVMDLGHEKKPVDRLPIPHFFGLEAPPKLAFAQIGRGTGESMAGSGGPRPWKTWGKSRGVRRGSVGSSGCASSSSPVYAKARILGFFFGSSPSTRPRNPHQGPSAQNPRQDRAPEIGRGRLAKLSKGPCEGRARVSTRKGPFVSGALSLHFFRKLHRMEGALSPICHRGLVADGRGGSRGSPSDRPETLAVGKTTRKEGLGLYNQKGFNPGPFPKGVRTL